MSAFIPRFKGLRVVSGGAPRAAGLLLWVAPTLGLWACSDGGEAVTAGGLAVETSGEAGPRIVFDPLAQPLPEVPFPNDLSLRVTDDTLSGKAWNLATQKPSHHRSLLFDRLDRVDGFGPFAPVYLSFEGPLDLATVSEATVMIVNIEPGHPREGERVPLDLGQGYFPTDMRRGSFFGQDPSASAFDLVFGPSDFAEPGEGVPSIPGPEDAPEGEPPRLVHYERETNTLILRPVIPLAEHAKHAVLITRGVKGEYTDAAGETHAGPVRSPFDAKAHAAQADDVRRAVKLAGIGSADLAFGWTYTTADVSTPMANLREGLYGEGPLKNLNQHFRPGLVEIRDTGISHDADGVQFPADPRDHVFTLQGEFLSGIFELVSSVQGDSNYKLKFPNVDYVVFGSVESPNLRTLPDKVMDLDLHTGEGQVETQTVPFLVTVPKTTDQFKPPFPVMFYFHGTGTSRMESLAIADAMARQGIAVMAFDEVGHGPLIPDIPTLLAENPGQSNLATLLPPLLARLLVPDRVSEFVGLSLEDALAKFYQIGFFAELAVIGRSEDANGDGYFAIAEGFFSANPFRQCASFWQDLVDFMSMVQTVRGFRQSAVPAAIDDPKNAPRERLMANLLAGDFNGDGVLDIGGPDVALSAAGTSLGGFHALLGAAIEPEITTVTPIVAGGGFTDIMVRSSLRFITERLFLDVLGTVVVACPGPDGNVYLSQGNDADNCRADDLSEKAMASFSATGGVALSEGTPVSLFNLANGEEAHGVVNAAGGFSIAVESDLGDLLRVVVEPPGGMPMEVEFESHFEGSGYRRNSPEFRRAVGVQQHVFDRCDPINFASHLFVDPLPGHKPTNVLFLNAVGDDTVPLSTGVLLALASGVFGTDRAQWEPHVKALIATGLLRNRHYDVDDVRGDNPPEMPAVGAPEPVDTPTGKSSVRYADVNGKHEYIAGYEKDGFQVGLYHQHLLTIFHRCEGRVVLDQPVECLQSRDCPTLDAVMDLPGCRAP